MLKKLLTLLIFTVLVSPVLAQQTRLGNNYPALPIDGGTGLATIGSANQCLQVNSGGTALIYGSCGGGGVTSFTGDGTILNNSASTGVVTATLGNAAANSVLGNNTSGSAAPSYQTAITVSGTIQGQLINGTALSSQSVAGQFLTHAGKALIQFQANTPSGTLAYIGTPSSSGGFAVFNNSTSVQNLSVLDSGGVGISTSAPLSTLSVAGNAAIGTYGGGASTIAAPSNGLIVSGSVGIGTNSPTTGATLDVRGPIKLMGYIVSTLPSGANASIGMQAYVTDAVACTFLATLTGGSSTFCPVIYNGTAWIGG